LKGELFEGPAQVAFATYQIEEVNRRQTDPTTPTNPCFVAPVLGAVNTCYVAEGEVRSRGFDAEISGMLTDAWNVFAGYT
jgi:outer membrane receptor for ferric coprogen and ferric-rhodotorulic acid